MAVTLKKGAVFWISKGKYVFFAAKQLHIYYLVRQWCIEKDMDFFDAGDFDDALKSVLEKYDDDKHRLLNSFDARSYLQPLPDCVVDAVPPDAMLFPEDFDPVNHVFFFDRVMGMGIKCRNLMAESCYGKNLVSVCSTPSLLNGLHTIADTN